MERRKENFRVLLQKIIIIMQYITYVAVYMHKVKLVDDIAVFVDVVIIGISCFFFLTNYQLHIVPWWKFTANCHCSIIVYKTAINSFVQLHVMKAKDFMHYSVLLLIYVRELIPYIFNGWHCDAISLQELKIILFIRCVWRSPIVSFIPWAK